MDYPLHRQFHEFIKQLNHIYLENPSFWNDYEESGFQWLDCHQEEKCIYVLKRNGQKQDLIAVFNFSEEDYVDYKLDLQENGVYRLLLDSELCQFGGGAEDDGEKLYKTENGSITLNVPHFSAQYYIVC